MVDRVERRSKTDVSIYSFAASQSAYRMFRIEVYKEFLFSVIPVRWIDIFI